MMAREIRTLLPTLKSNLKPVLPSHEAVTKKDDQLQTSKRQYFDKRREVRPLLDLQPGDSVRVKLDQQKGWKMSGKVIARSPTPRSYVIQTPFRKVRRNCRHLRTAISADRVEMPDEQDLDLEPALHRSYEVRSAKRMEDVWESHWGKPSSLVICHPDTFQKGA